MKRDNVFTALILPALIVIFIIELNYVKKQNGINLLAGSTVKTKDTSASLLSQALTLPAEPSVAYRVTLEDSIAYWLVGFYCEYNGNRSYGSFTVSSGGGMPYDTVMGGLSVCNPDVFERSYQLVVSNIK